MFNYIKNIYRQINKIYQIKKQLDKIHNALPTYNPTYNPTNNLTNTTIDELTPEFDNLKTMIFNCGSLYVKFLQWYISKLKSHVVNVVGNVVCDDNINIEKQNTIKFIEYFEDIFENCPFHSLEHTKEIFKT